MKSLRDGIKDDWKIFDNIMTLTLAHRGPQNVDFDLQQLSSTVSYEECEGCLVREVSKRQTGSVRQVFEKGKSITADNFELQDTIIEVPVKEGRVIEIGDHLIDETGNLKWQILAVDYSTLRTRHRLGCRIL